jgi:hypothetical protein
MGGAPVMRPRSSWFWAVLTASLPAFVIAAIGIIKSASRANGIRWSSLPAGAQVDLVAVLLLIIAPVALGLAVILAVLGATRRSVRTAEKVGMWLMVILAFSILAAVH